MTNEEQIRALLSSLKATAKAAEHASLTGSLKNGAAAGIKSYNGIVAKLRQLGMIDESIFQPLDENESIDSLGFSARQLAAYLEGVLGKEERGDDGCCGPFNFSDIENFMANAFGFSRSREREKRRDSENKKSGG